VKVVVLHDTVDDVTKMLPASMGTSVAAAAAAVAGVDANAATLTTRTCGFGTGASTEPGAAWECVWTTLAGDGAADPRYRSA